VKITFCVTCYDGDVHLLEDRLLSIYSEQTVQPDEVLVITSGVGSGSIVWDASKPNLTIKTFEQRKLPGGARNQGGKFAKGDIVCFCDVDDPIHPQKCEIVKKIFEENPEVDALVHSYKFNTKEFNTYDPSEIPIEKVTEVDERWEKEQNYVFNPHKELPKTCVITPSKGDVHHGHLSCKKEIFNDLKYREEMWLGEDGDFCQSIVKSSYSLFYTPLVLINYIT
tara:strand:- start:380 stop:1051 length:672 start_codon:yes stop_codon:yes gene_type:complete